MREALVIAFWRGRHAGRRLLHGALHTLEGRLAALACVVAVPGLLAALRGAGGPGTLGPEPASAGVGLLASAGALISASFLVPAVLARALALEADDDPLRARPRVLGVAAAVTALSVALGSALYLGLFTFLLHRRAFVDPTLLWMVPGALVSWSTAVAEGTRRLLRGGHPMESARRLRLWAGPGFLIAFVGSALGPEPLARALPAFAWGVSPAVSVLTPSFGALGALGRLLLSAALTLLPPILLLGAWSAMTPGELALVPSGSSRAASGSAAPRIPWNPSPHNAVAPLFDAMDRCVRARAASGAWVAAAIVVALLLVGRPDAGVSAGLSAAAVLALPHLGWLGTHGDAIGALTLARPPLELLTARFHASCLAVATGALSSAAVLLALGGAVPSLIRAAPLLAGALVGSAAFTALAVGLGAALPDPSCRSPLLPGAKRAAILGYLALSAAVVASAAVHPGPPTGSPHHPPIATVVAASALSVGAILLGWAAFGYRKRAWRP